MNRSSRTAWMLGAKGSSAGSAISCAGVAALVLLAGCAGSGTGSKATRTVSAGDFQVAGRATASDAGSRGSAQAGGAAGVTAQNASTPAAAATEASPAAASPSAAVPVAQPRQPEGGAGAVGEVRRVGSPRVVAVVGDPPAAPAAGASPVGHDVVADSMVGQIQGRPVYASEVLTPLDGRLRQLSKDVRTPADLAAWVNGATKVIADVVKERVNDEVALSEARSRLTPEQKQGLVYFLQRVDQWATGQAGGSRAQAEEAIRAREGEEFDKYLQITRDKTLIQELVKDNVGPNVRVPWRRVERYYADNQASINPPPYGVVRVLMVDGGNAERLAKAEAAAKEPSGEAFRELATSAANEFRASDRVSGKEIKDGLIIRPIDAKPFEQQEWVGNPAWNRAASTLKPGEVAGPIEAGTYRVFIRREADFVSPHRSLEDAQLEIYAGLLQLKSQQEQNEFYTQLRGKGSFTPVRQMTFELLVLAAQRHLPPEMSGAVRSSFEGEFKTDAVLERSPAPPVLDDMSINPSPGAAPPK